MAGFGRPLRWADALAAYLVPLAVTGGALAVAAWLPIGRLPLIPCGFLKLTGCPCLFCGTTRGFYAAAHWDWAAAWFQSPLGAALYLLAAAVMLACAIGLLARRQLWPDGWWGRSKFPLLAGAIVALLANWIYRLAHGLK